MIINLKKMTDDDLSLFKLWLDKPHVSKWYHHKNAWIYEFKHRNDEFDFVKHYIVMCDDKPIGFCQYYDYKKGKETFHGNLDIKNTYSIDYLIGESDYLNRHLSKEIVYELEKIISKENKVEKIIVKPEKDNVRSRRLLLSSGYRHIEKEDYFLKEY